MRFAVFLRGINVGGIKVPMADLRDLLAGLDVTDVATYIQSGNVTLTTTMTAATLKSVLQKALSERFHYEAYVLVYDHDRLVDMVAGYPFAVDDDHHRYLILCADDAVRDELVSAADADEVAAGDGVVYWRCPKGSTLSTPFAKKLGAKKYKAATTSRNLNTVEKMLQPPEHPGHA